MVKYCKVCKAKLRDCNRSGYCGIHYRKPKKYKCEKCGKLINKTKSNLCRKCYNKNKVEKNSNKKYCVVCGKQVRKDNKSGYCRKHYKNTKKYYCKTCGGIMSKNRSGLCKKCYSITKMIRTAKFCEDCGKKINHNSKTNLCRKCNVIRNVKNKPKCLLCGDVVKTTVKDRELCYKCYSKYKKVLRDETVYFLMKQLETKSYCSVHNLFHTDTICPVCLGNSSNIKHPCPECGCAMSKKKFRCIECTKKDLDKKYGGNKFNNDII